MKKAVFAGTFDPITKGHEWIIEKSAPLFDEVVVLIAVNPDKTALFSVEERIELISQSIKHLPNVSTAFYEGYTAEYCKSIGASYLIRGIRDSKDLKYEKVVSETNQKINPDLQTVILMTPDELGTISSTLTKKLAKANQWSSLESLVSRHVSCALIKNHYGPILKKYWMQLDGHECFKVIMDRLCEPSRYYHSPQHIAELLKSISSLKIKKEEKEILMWAAFFHDIVYDPTKGDNEEKSVDLWRGFAEKILLKRSTVDTVAKIILATKKHSSTEDSLVDLFLDLDLSILGASKERFEEYEDQIKKEYSFVAKDVYIRERSRILENFLNQRKIFKTKHMSHLNAQAKSNLKRLLKQLAKV